MGFQIYILNSIIFEPTINVIVWREYNRIRSDNNEGLFIAKTLNHAL